MAHFDTSFPLFFASFEHVNNTSPYEELAYSKIIFIYVYV